MTAVGAYEAKTRLSHLLERVAQGEHIAITRHGVPVAVLVPASERPDPKEVLQEIRAFRKRHRLEGLTVRQLIEEGRR